jgi:hypothetical protein
MSKVKVNWTPEEAHTRKADHPHGKAAWTLWILAAAMLAGWIASMALGAKMGGPADLLLAGFAVLMLVCVLMGFRNVAYLEPMRIARERILGWRWGRWGQRHPPGA